MQGVVAGCDVETFEGVCGECHVLLCVKGQCEYLCEFVVTAAVK